MSPTSPRSASARTLLGLLIAVLAVVAPACGRGGSTTASSTGPEPEVATTVPPTTTTLPPTTTAAPTTTEAPTTTTTEAPPPPLPTFGPAALGAGSATVYVLGDSVILGAETTVPPALVGWDVTFDAKESRRIDQGSSIVRDHGGAMGRVLVVHLCTNWGGGDYGAAADRLLGELVGVERVVWVTCTPWLPAVGAADEAIRALPRRHPDVVVADWAAVSGGPGYTYADGLHLKPAGAAALARLVADAVGPAPG